MKIDVRPFKHGEIAERRLVRVEGGPQIFQVRGGGVLRRMTYEPNFEEGRASWKCRSPSGSASKWRAAPPSSLSRMRGVGLVTRPRSPLLISRSPIFCRE